MAEKKSKRITKPVQLIPIAGKEEADEILRRIGQLQLQIQGYESEAEKKITEIQSDLQDHTNPLHVTIEQMRLSLESYATANRQKLFGKAKSIKLQFGRLGWRKGNPRMVVEDEEGLVWLVRKKLKDLAAGLIVVKESVDKAALKRLTDEQLKKIGVTREATERFFADAEATESVDYGESEQA